MRNSILLKGNGEDLINNNTHTITTRRDQRMHALDYSALRKELAHASQERLSLSVFWLLFTTLAALRFIVRRLSFCRLVFCNFPSSFFCARFFGNIARS